MEGIATLDIDKNGFAIEKEWGKMIPLIFDISSQKQVSDVLKMIEFKRGAK